MNWNVKSFGFVENCTCSVPEVYQSIHSICCCIFEVVCEVVSLKSYYDLYIYDMSNDGNIFMGLLDF